MRSATAFLPLSITWFMNLARIWLPYFGSSRISRLAATRRLGIDKPSNGLQVSSGLTAMPHPTLLLSTQIDKKVQAALLRTLGTVLRTALLTVFDAGGIQRTAHGVVTNTWQVL